MPEERDEKDIRDADEVIREYYEGDRTVEAESDEEVRDEFGDVQATRGAETRRGEIREYEPGATDVAGGDIDARWDREDVGDETVGGSHALPDQDIVEEVGSAAGMTYQDNEPLNMDDKVEHRDADRWELDPASSEDYQERQRFDPSAEQREEAPRKKAG